MHLPEVVAWPRPLARVSSSCGCAEVQGCAGFSSLENTFEVPGVIFNSSHSISLLRSSKQAPLCIRYDVHTFKFHQHPLGEETEAQRSQVPGSKLTELIRALRARPRGLSHTSCLLLGPAFLAEARPLSVSNMRLGTEDRRAPTLSVLTQGCRRGCKDGVSMGKHPCVRDVIQQMTLRTSPVQTAGGLGWLHPCPAAVPVTTLLPVK